MAQSGKTPEPSDAGPASTPPATLGEAKRHAQVPGNGHADTDALDETLTAPPEPGPRLAVSDSTALPEPTPSPDPIALRKRKISSRPPSKRRSERPAPASKNKPAKALRRMRLRSWLSGLGTGLISSVLFTAATGAGFLLHVDLPASRRVLAETIEKSYAASMRGQLRVEGLRHISPQRLEIDTLRLIDASGREVVTLSGVRIRANLVDLGWDGVFGGSKTTLVLNHIRAERTTWQIVPDADGTPSLVNAMNVRPSSEPKQPSTSAPRYIRVWIPTIELGQSYVRGKIGDLPTAEVSLSSARGSLLATPKGLAIDVQRFGATLRGLLGADAVGTGDFHIRSPGAVWSNFNGQLGDVQIGAFFKSHGGELETRIELPRAEPEPVRALFADWPLYQPVTARITASGKLPKLQTKANFSVGEATIEATGPVRVGGELGANLDVKAKHVDLRAVWPDAPATSIDASTTLEIWNRKGEVVVDVNGSTKATQIAGIDIPVADWNGTADSHGFRGKTNIHEPGVPIRADFEISPTGRIDLDVHARRFALTDSPRLRPYVRGFLDVSAKGSIVDGRINAAVSATGDHLTVSAVQIGTAKLNGTLSGPLTKPEAISVVSKVSGSGFQSAGLFFEEFTGRATGLMLKPKLKATFSGEFRPKVVAEAQLSPPLNGSKKTTLSKLKVSIERDDTKVIGHATSLDIIGKRVDLKNLVVTGAGGTLEGSASLRNDELHADIRGNGVNLSAFSRAIGLPRDTLEGTLNVDAKVLLKEDASSGYVSVALGRGSLMGIQGIDLMVRSDFAQSRVEGGAQIIVADWGGLRSTWKGSVDGDPLSATAWKRAVGKLDVNADQLNLGGLEVGLRSQGVDAVRGRAAVNLQATRSDPDKLPEVTFMAGTQGLEVDFHTEGKDKQRTDYSIKDIDLATSGKADGDRGETRASFGIYYRAEELAVLSGSVGLDFERLLKANSKQALGMLANAPIDARLAVPDRGLAQLPEQVRVSGFDGSVAADVRFRGSVAEPEVEAAVFASGIKPESSRLAQPLDGVVRAHYAAKTGDFDGSAEVKVKGRRVALGKSSGNASWADIKAGRSVSEDWWQVGATLRLEDLPIEAFPPFSDNYIQAKLTGSMSAQRAKGKALVVASVRVKDPVLDRVRLGQGSISFRSDNERADATLKLSDASGNLEASVRTGLEWVDLFPALDQRASVRVDLSATNYDAVVLQPFLDRMFTQVSGRVDGKFHAILRRQEADPEREGPGWTGTIDGSANVRDGVLQITTLGLELEDVRFGVNAKSDGVGTSIELSGLKAKVRSDVDNVEGTSRFYMSGLELSRGAGWLRMDSVPLLLEGVNQGTGTGYATFRMEKIPEGMRLELDIPRLEARLPRSSSRSVYDIDDNPDIQVAQLLREPKRKSDEKPTLWLVPIKLGREVRVTRSDMEVYVRGEPTLRLEAKPSLEGFIELVPGGRIPALGKAFVIERGLISFDTGDPTDPHLNATASWRAADNTTIYVDVTGTLKHAELGLRSDPPRPEPEIIALMLGGVSTTGDDTQQSGAGADNTGGGGTGSAAVNIGGGVAAIGLNELLADTPLGGVELRADATSKAAPSYTAAYRASSKVYFEGTYQAADNSGIDDTVKEGFTGTVDYRFLPNWSLRTQIGNTGTALDLIWQYRY
ncbi:MAG: translocation/assembly module TamB domain-containing protein [Polyangiaceae bacterium]